VGYKILLADDSVTVQKIITLTFSDEGVDVITVNNGDEAINRLQYLRPALVMADVSIPGRNGYEICEFVKMHPEMRETPVILLVPAFEPFDEERARRIGADYHLTKPFQSIRTLISTVKNLAERKVDAEFSVVGSGLTAVRESDHTDIGITEVDPKRAKIEELIRMSSNESSGESLGNGMDNEILLEVDLTGGRPRRPDSLADASPAEVIDSPEAIGFTEVPGKMTIQSPFKPAAIRQESSFQTEVSTSSPTLLDFDDDVLELGDVLPDQGFARGAVADEPAGERPAFSPDPAPVRPQAEPQDGAAGTKEGAHIPPGVIDEIVNRVSARLSAELSEKLSGEIARRVASEVAELIKRQFPAEPAAYRNSDNLLDID
jgi:CheY-like chemotaxis protein